MELYKRTILLESLKSRETGLNYGVITANTIYIDVLLTQTIEDMGMFTDIENESQSVLYPLTLGGVPNLNNPLVDKLLSSGYTFNFMYVASQTTAPQSLSDFYSYGDRISAYTTSRIGELKKYDVANPYEEMFLFDIGSYVDYQGNTIENSISTIFDMDTSNYTGYTFDTENDINLGTINQETGLMFRDLGELVSNYDEEINANIFSQKANVSYIGQGWNQTNISLSGNVKEEKYLGITSVPEVQSEVFIDRGGYSVLEPHLRLSEIESLEHLENYSNGSYYKIKKQTI